MISAGYKFLSGGVEFSIPRNKLPQPSPEEGISGLKFSDLLKILCLPH